MTDKFIIMGVAGCGKTSVGEALAERTGLRFIDGDTLHPQANIDKMANGIPLDDADRKPWLEAVGKTLQNNAGQAGKIAIGCSALKRSYRDIIRDHAGHDVCFILLDGSRELISQRMAARKGHFMPLSLLDSQFATLEKPQGDERTIIVGIDDDLPSIVEKILTGMNANLD